MHPTLGAQGNLSTRLIGRLRRHSSPGCLAGETTPKPSPGLYRNWSRYLKLRRVFVSPLGSQVPDFIKGVPDGDDADDKLQLLAME